MSGIGDVLYRSTAFLRWFGRNSYEVYLTHMFAIWPMVGLFFYFHQSIHLAPLWFLAILALAGGLGSPGSAFLFRTAQSSPAKKVDETSARRQQQRQQANRIAPICSSSNSASS